MENFLARLKNGCKEAEWPEARPGPEKIGLALSGGGFRAAFFHIGVLARLAELGILPKVQVISTVSGGSIVGALYYLRLKALLEEKPDSEICRADYLKLVAEVEERLLDGVQKNVRARMFSNVFKNLKMVRRSYSRSDRTGDLYDRYFYKDAWNRKIDTRSLGRDKQIEMRDLRIKPKGTLGFDIKRDNTARRAKVPALLINATSLNSGHNWRFEAIRMGEERPPKGSVEDEIAKEVDKSMRLEQGYFDPEPDQDPVPGRQVAFPLGLAVAASASFPPVFQPLAITGMYEGIRVRLVDGGVQDNQGLQGLFDQKCTRLIVSDASGQLDDKEKPFSIIPNVLKRSSSIAQNRIRSEQLIDAESGKTYDYALMHMRKGLQEKAVKPRDSLADAIENGRDTARTAAFGVKPEVQSALSKIRTDLDYFSRTEAHSVELDGYLMSRHELTSAGFDRFGDGAEACAWPWAFGGMADSVGDGAEDYVGKLKAGKRAFFRLSFLRPWLAIPYLVVWLAVAAAIGLGTFCGTRALLDGAPGWAEVLSWTAALIVYLELAFFVLSNFGVWKTKLYPQ